MSKKNDQQDNVDDETVPRARASSKSYPNRIPLSEEAKVATESVTSKQPFRRRKRASSDASRYTLPPNWKSGDTSSAMTSLSGVKAGLINMPSRGSAARLNEMLASVPPRLRSVGASASSGSSNAVGGGTVAHSISPSVSASSAATAVESSAEPTTSSGSAAGVEGRKNTSFKSGVRFQEARESSQLTNQRNQWQSNKQQNLGRDVTSNSAAAAASAGDNSSELAVLRDEKNSLLAVLSSLEARVSQQAEQLALAKRRQQQDTADLVRRLHDREQLYERQQARIEMMELRAQERTAQVQALQADAAELVAALAASMSILETVHGPGALGALAQEHSGAMQAVSRGETLQEKSGLERPARRAHDSQSTSSIAAVAADEAATRGNVLAGASGCFVCGKRDDVSRMTKLDGKLFCSKHCPQVLANNASAEFKQEMARQRDTPYARTPRVRRDERGRVGAEEAEESHLGPSFQEHLAYFLNLDQSDNDEQRGGIAERPKRRSAKKVKKSAGASRATAPALGLSSCFVCGCRVDSLAPPLDGKRFCSKHAPAVTVNNPSAEMTRQLRAQRTQYSSARWAVPEQYRQQREQQKQQQQQQQHGWHSGTATLGYEKRPMPRREPRPSTTRSAERLLRETLQLRDAADEILHDSMNGSAGSTAGTSPSLRDRADGRSARCFVCHERRPIFATVDDKDFCSRHAPQVRKNRPSAEQMPTRPLLAAGPFDDADQHAHYRSVHVSDSRREQPQSGPNFYHTADRAYYAAAPLVPPSNVGQNNGFSFANSTPMPQYRTLPVPNGGMQLYQDLPTRRRGSSAVSLQHSSRLARLAGSPSSLVSSATAADLPELAVTPAAQNSSPRTDEESERRKNLSTAGSFNEFLLEKYQQNASNGDGQSRSAGTRHAAANSEHGGGRQRARHHDAHGNQQRQASHHQQQHHHHHHQRQQHHRHHGHHHGKNDEQFDHVNRRSASSSSFSSSDFHSDDENEVNNDGSKTSSSSSVSDNDSEPRDERESTSGSSSGVGDEASSSFSSESEKTDSNRSHHYHHQQQPQHHGRRANYHRDEDAGEEEKFDRYAYSAPLDLSRLTGDASIASAPSPRTSALQEMLRKSMRKSSVSAGSGRSSANAGSPVAPSSELLSSLIRRSSVRYKQKDSK